MAQIPPLPQPISEVPVDAQALVQSWYQRFFGREADPSGLRTWTESLLTGNPPALTLATMLCGEEYYKRQGSSPEGFVIGLYRDLYGRPPTPQELQAATQRLVALGNSDQDRLDVAYRIIRRAPNVAPAAPGLGSEEGTALARHLGCRIRVEDGLVRVYSVPPGSLAAQIGLEPGDRIVALDRRQIRSADQLHDALVTSLDGGPVTIRIERRGQPLTSLFQCANNSFVVTQPIALPIQDSGDLGCRIRWNDRGGKVIAVRPGSLAERLGLAAGDTIWGVDGRGVRSHEQFAQALYQDNGGRTHFMSMVRNDQTYVAYFRVVFNRIAVVQPFQPPQPAGSDLLGCQLESGLQGVRVRSVAPGTIMAQLGVRPGDVIFSIGGYPVRTSDQLHEILENRRGKQRFRIDVLRQNIPLEGSLAFRDDQLVVREALRPDRD